MSSHHINSIISSYHINTFVFRNEQHRRGKRTLCVLSFRVGTSQSNSGYYEREKYGIGSFSSFLFFFSFFFVSVSVFISFFVNNIFNLALIFIISFNKTTNIIFLLKSLKKGLFYLKTKTISASASFCSFRSQNRTFDEFN